MKLSLAFLIVALCIGNFAYAYDMHDNAILHARRGQLYLEREQPHEAIEEYKAAILLRPYTGLAASLYHNLGLAYRQAGQTALAIASFQRACRIQPTYALYFQSLAETYAMTSLSAQAEQELQAIVQDNPEDGEAWFMLGLLYKENGNQREAKACFNRLLKLKPESDLARAARTAL